MKLPRLNFNSIKSPNDRQVRYTEDTLYGTVEYCLLKEKQITN